MRKPKVLVIDDNRDFVDDLLLLLSQDYECSCVHSGEAGLRSLERGDVDLVLLDIDLGPGLDGFDLLEKVSGMEDPVPVVMITRDQSIETVVKAMKEGACDYVGKKPDLSELKMVIERALSEYELRKENRLLREEISVLTGELLGESEAILEIRKETAKLAGTDSTVLITGESGTGKEVVARQLHEASRRKGRPLVTVNCAAIPRELFGHEKGAFTGALKRRTGKFELADGGTIFLDEIGELDNTAQAKFLRVLQEKKIERVGSERSRTVDVRVIAATNKDLDEQVRNGRFREDLYYRLNVTRIHIPPLRERRQDIPLLAREITRRKCHELKKEVRGVSEDALQKMIAYDWPGNVRELENVIENALIYSESPTLGEDLFPTLSLIGDNYSSPSATIRIPVFSSLSFFFYSVV